MFNNKILYVQVPQTKSDCSFLNSKEWVYTAIQISGLKHGGTFEATYRMTNHIIRFYRSLPSKHSEYLCVNQWVQHNTKPWYAPKRLVVQVNRNWKSTSVLTLAKASVPPDED